MTAPTNATRHEYAGLRVTRKNRQTGTQVSVYDGEAAGMDTEGGRWQTVCEPHAWIISHDTLATALSWLSRPLDWCDECKRAAGLPDTAGLLPRERSA